MKLFLKAGVLALSATAISILVFSGCSENTQPINNSAPPAALTPPVEQRPPSTPPAPKPAASKIKTKNVPMPTAKRIAWQPSFETALEKARAAQKPIMVDFFATWCGPCHFLAEQVYPLPAMVQESQNFINVQVDVDKHPDIARKYQAASLPTVAFLDASGKELSRQEGVPQDPQAAAEMFVGAMKDARAKFAGTPA